MEDIALRPTSGEAALTIRAVSKDNNMAEEKDRPLVVVAIGASAGGFTPIKELINSIVPESGMAYVIIQHLDPKHESHLVSLLESKTAMRVMEAQNGMIVEPNCVYTNPSAGYLAIRGNRFVVTEGETRKGMRKPIDYFFFSLAESLKERSVAVVLSGTGSDGTLGIRAIRREGGITLAQDPDTAQYSDMPRSAMETGMVDAVLPVEQINQYLLDQVRGAVTRMSLQDRLDMPPGEVEAILDLILSGTRCDFRNYKRSTILRRIHRRMGLNRLDSAGHYLELLRRHPKEVENLRNDLLIGVTSFFREPDAFGELQEKVIGPLFKNCKGEEPLRIWATGCATGEEAYSLVMVALEEQERKGRICPLQVFASDIDQPALEVARAGEYGPDVENEVSPERLRRFFLKQERGYRVSKQLREPIVFSHQNIISDPPFSRLDLISCRNVLIYLQPEVQRKVVAIFAFALKPGGYLFLGKSDPLGGRDDLFEMISKKGRIYRRRHTAKPDIIDFPIVVAEGRAKGALRKANGRPLTLPVALAMVNQQILLDYFQATVVIIDHRGKILHFFGDASRYLTLPTGEANLDLLKMSRERLSLMLRPALFKVFQGERRVFLHNIPLQRGEEVQLINVTVQQVEHPEWDDRLVAVIFEDARDVARPPAKGQSLQDDDIVRELETEIKKTKEELQAAYEDFESSSEELRAANEEVMSMNEELQSANEELETSKEELQAINEELITVNNELSEKLDELRDTNNDMANLLNATGLATIFLDMNLKIKRFTQEATQMLNLINEDKGRPVEHISQRFRGEPLMKDARQVLANLRAIEKEVQHVDGSWYVLRLYPYRTLDNRIEGVVVTFVDVTQLKLAESFSANIVEMVRHPLIVLKADYQILAANRAFFDLMGLEEKDVIGAKIYHVAVEQWDLAKLRQLLEEAIPTVGKLRDYPMDIRTPDGRKQPVALNARRIDKKPGKPYLILLAMEAAGPKVD